MVNPLVRLAGLGFSVERVDVLVSDAATAVAGCGDGRKKSAVAPASVAA